jgi:hypothetical protein
MSASDPAAAFVAARRLEFPPTAKSDAAAIAMIGLIEEHLIKPIPVTE